MILDLDPKQKKKRGAEWFEIEDDIDQEWIEEHQAFLVAEQRTKIEKKFAKENEKLIADGEKEMKAKELSERMDVAIQLEKKFRKENKTHKVEAEGKGPTVEKFISAIEKIDNRIATMELQAEDREGNKEVALGTSKIVSGQTAISVKGSANHDFRTTSTQDLQWFSPRSSTCLLKSFSLRR